MTTDTTPAISLVLFHADLRLYDHSALVEAIRRNPRVAPCFIFTPEQLDRTQNPYYNPKIVHFMCEALEDLSAECAKHGSPLNVFCGTQQDVISTLLSDASLQIEAVYMHHDYTPYARERTEQISNVCREAGVGFVALHDRMFQPPDAISKPEGSPYVVFSPYHRQAKDRSVKMPVPVMEGMCEFVSISSPHRMSSISQVREKYKIDECPNNLCRGGRTAALDMMRKIRIEGYKTNRDMLDQDDGTTRLSCYLKFGCISPRELYHYVGEHPHPKERAALQRQMYWRDFYIQIGYHYPHVMEQQNFNRNYDVVEWETDESTAVYQAFLRAETGYPVVDAGLRQLYQTGYMHNRTRMIVASFLTKDLHYHWAIGERLFAQHLIDYDPLLNNGNWQWTASTGCDAQPYFRIFNPTLQQKKFDPEAVYIRRWIPELRDFTPAQIHQYEETDLSPYPPPIVVHSEQKDETLRRFAVMKKN